MVHSSDPILVWKFSIWSHGSINESFILKILLFIDFIYHLIFRANWWWPRHLLAACQYKMQILFMLTSDIFHFKKVRFFIQILVL